MLEGGNNPHLGLWEIKQAADHRLDKERDRLSSANCELWDEKKTGAPGMITTNFIFFDMDDRIERSKAGSKNRLIVDIGFGWNKLILFWIVIKIKTSIQ